VAIYGLKQEGGWRVFPGLHRYAFAGFEAPPGGREAFARLESWFKGEKKKLLLAGLEERRAGREPSVKRLVGVWRAGDFLVKLLGDGSFYGGVVNEGGGVPGKFSGRWALEEGAVTWHYERQSGALMPTGEGGKDKPDVNPIVELTGEKLVLREADGTKTIWNRTEAFLGFDKFFRPPEPKVKGAVPAG
jgi:hypothetical protein